MDEPLSDETLDLAREIVEQRTGVPAYLADVEAWEAARAEAIQIMATDPPATCPYCGSRHCSRAGEKESWLGWATFRAAGGHCPPTPLRGFA